MLIFFVKLVEQEVLLLREEAWTSRSDIKSILRSSAHLDRQYSGMLEAEDS